MAGIPQELISLRRRDTGQQWGFKMLGGSDCGVPIFVSAVNPKGIAGKLGLGVGDVVLAICGTSVIGWTQQQMKSELMRAGNEVDLVVVKGRIDIKDPVIREAVGLPVAGTAPDNKRSELVEESINPHMNEGTKYRNVTPKTYKILEEQLASEEPLPSAMNPKQQQQQQPAQQMRPVHAQQSAPPRGGGAAKPSSIFDRKKQDRSDYLVASGQTIQKTFGEQ